jgi:hypothetical protein
MLFDSNVKKYGLSLMDSEEEQRNFKVWLKI